MGLLNKFRTNKKSTLTEDVIEHLTDFLNTKRNFGAYPVDYGIDSYIYLDSGSKVLLQLIADVRMGLEKYEKRVSDIQIEPAASQQSSLVAFKIECKIEQITHAFHLSFHHQTNQFNLEAKK